MNKTEKTFEDGGKLLSIPPVIAAIQILKQSHRRYFRSAIQGLHRQKKYDKDGAGTVVGPNNRR